MWSSLLLAVIAFAFLNASVAAQSFSVGYRKSNQATKRSVGSAKHLEGVVHVYHSFLSDETSSWTDFERNRVRAKLREAYDFITLQSRLHDKQVTFVDEFGPNARLDIQIPRDAHADPKWTEYAILSSSNKTGNRLVEHIKGQSKPDSVIVCLHVHKPALSYNLAYYKPVSERYRAERMVCFTAYPDGRETSSATYAHEILHLFGAGDLYFPYDKDSRRKDHAQRLFPNDVMFRVDYDMTRLNVGPFTAYRIGWTNRLDPRYSSFED